MNTPQPPSPSLNVADILKKHLDLLRGDHPPIHMEVGDYNHIAGVLVSPCNAQGTYATIITHRGVELVPAVEVGRGVLVSILMISEVGESVIRNYHFQKGRTFTSDTHVDGAAEDFVDDAGRDAGLDIWRD